MKTLPRIVGALLILSFTHGGFAASSGPGQTAKISGFAGRYTGTMLLASGGTAASGTTTGTISASKRKERGTVSLNSVLIVTGSPLIWTETYGIRSKALSYLLNAGGTIGSGSGTVGIHKRSINYSGTFVAGSVAYSLAGTMRKNGRSLKISETIVGSGTTISITYDLKQRGKK
jgi:hypothetical protein